MKTTTVIGYGRNCNKTSSTIEGYTLNCDKSTSTIEGYYLNCGKADGDYYNEEAQVFPMCSSVVISILLANPSQTVNMGDVIDTTAIATYLDGSTGVVTCSASSFDANTPGEQMVTLTYSGLVGTAKTTGTLTCTLNVTVKDINN